MKYIKPLSLFLVAILLIVGVSADESSSQGFTPVNAAMSTYKPDTVMLSAGEDINVTWGEFYFLLHNTAAQVTNGFTEEIDWNEEATPGETWADIVLGYVVSQSEQVLIYRYAVKQLGITLNEDDIYEIEGYIEEIKASAENPAEFENQLFLEGFINEDVFVNMLFNDHLQQKLPVELYGLNYDVISDELVADYVEQNDYMVAKHILFMTPSEYDDISEEERAEAKAEARKSAENVLRQLKARQNNDDFAEYFAQMVAEHSEDPGSTNFPDGYLFQPYEMVEEFSDACAALKPGEMSGIVESTHGYHIILRLPVNYDMIPYSMFAQGQYYSLRQLTVFEDFDRRVQEWSETIDITYTRELDNLDIVKLFTR